MIRHARFRAMSTKVVAKATTKVANIRIAIFLISVLTSLSSAFSHAAEDRIELEVTRIKANQELPQILYVVPWKDVSGSNNTEQKLVLHDFFGDLYDPLIPSQVPTPGEPVAEPGK